MNNRNAIRLIVATLLTFLLTAPLLAQGKLQARQEPKRVTRVINGVTVTADVPGIILPTEANFNQYRNDLLVILTAQRATVVMMHLNDTVATIDTQIQKVTDMKFSDLGENYPGFPDLTALKAAVVNLQSLMAQAFARGGTRVAQFTLPPGDFPIREYASFCPLNPQPVEVGFSIGLVTLTAELVKTLAQDFCQQIIEILGGGGNFAIACIVTDIIYNVAKIVNYPIQACAGDTDTAISGAILPRLEYIHDLLTISIANDNSNKAMLSTQLTNAENHIVTNDNNNKAALSTQTATFQTLSVRMAIEANLAEDPTTLAGAGLFEMPASQGGYLEVARQILIDVYNAQVAAAGAGVTVYNPSTELSTGATLTSQGKYREAYYYYRKGYRSVVKYP